MNLRLPAFPLGLAMLLGLAAFAPAQEPGEADRPEAKEKADEGQAKSEASTKTSEVSKPKLERATFGGGCFWCLEAVFERVPGVKSVVSGYAGGSGPRPTYGLVSTGLTGHAEVVQITYDPEVVSFEELLQLFWLSHDPTTVNRQGPDVGTQYRSIILYHDDAQKQAALESYRNLTAARVFAAPIVTQLVPLRKFYPAEKHHQNYFRLNAGLPYCQEEIVPKLMKLEPKIRMMQRKVLEKQRQKEMEKAAGAAGDPEGVEGASDSAKVRRR